MTTMIGFDVSVHYLDAHGQRQTIATWAASNLDWINELLSQGKATLVQDSGGYPYLYEVPAAELQARFTHKDGDDLGRYLARKPGTGNWNQSPLPRGGIIHGDQLADYPPDRQLTVEAWDQS